MIKVLGYHLFNQHFEQKGLKTCKIFKPPRRPKDASSQAFSTSSVTGQTKTSTFGGRSWRTWTGFTRWSYPSNERIQVSVKYTRRTCHRNQILALSQSHNKLRPCPISDIFEWFLHFTQQILVHKITFIHFHEVCTTIQSWNIKRVHTNITFVVAEPCYELKTLSPSRKIMENHLHIIRPALWFAKQFANSATIKSQNILQPFMRNQN